MSIVFRYVSLLMIALVVLVVIIVIGNIIRSELQYWDDDPSRGATAAGMSEPDSMGDAFTRIVYPDQNWAPEESLFFYNTTQGSNLIPYDFALVLEQADAEQRFLSADNINRYRYLVQQPTGSNPDGLPLGFVKDTYQGMGDRERTYIGFTCAACHTNQVNVKQPDGSQVAVRVDGGPAMADMPAFLRGLQRALAAVTEEVAADDPVNREKRRRFIRNVLDRDGDYNTAEAVAGDIERYALRITLYNTINRSLAKNEQGNYSRRVAYGHARLDAFGRIFNRVIEHLQTRDQLQARIAAIPDIRPEQLRQIMQGTQTLLTAADREAIVLRTYRILRANGHNRFGALRAIISTFRNGIYNYANAPVSYPFLWDIAQHDYVQWNGISANAGVGPLGRNVGEVIGVFGTLDWHLSESCDLAAKLTGQCSLLGEPTNKAELLHFTSSVNIYNLGKLEQQLASLQSPWWQDPTIADVMPAIDDELAADGRRYFEERCVMCHHDIDRTDPYRKVVAFMSNVSKVGTDPAMAHNSVSYRGESGLLQDLYVKVGSGALVMQANMPVASLLTLAAQGVVVTPDPDKSWLTARLESLINIYGAYRNNDVKPSNRLGSYLAPTDANPYSTLKAYKGRPLNGIWATAPYLHNGAVPTLYHLMLPADRRPKTFMVGSRELEPDYVGFKYQGYDGGTEFNTALPGNDNGGHEYAACGRRQVAEMQALQYQGWRCEPFTHEQRMAVVEYLKTL